MTQQLSDFTFAPDIAGLPFLNRSQTWGLITSIATPFCNVSRGFCSIFNSNVMQSNNLLFVWLMYNEDVLNDSILFRKNNPNWIVGLPPSYFPPSNTANQQVMAYVDKTYSAEKKNKKFTFLDESDVEKGTSSFALFFLLLPLSSTFLF
jgi:hypothetical protein